jgi:hypothetical protein
MEPGESAEACYMNQPTAFGGEIQSSVIVICKLDKSLAIDNDSLENTLPQTSVNAEIPAKRREPLF